MAVAKGLAKYVPLLEHRAAHPMETIAEVAEHFGYSEGAMGRIVNSELFMMALYGLQQKAMTKIENKLARLKEKAEEATGEAIDFNKEVLKAAHPVDIKQESSKQILALGHAKAVEKHESKNLTAVANLPQDVVAQLLQAAQRLSVPFTPTRPLLPAEESDE